MKYPAASAPIALIGTLIAVLIGMAVLPLSGCEREPPAPPGGQPVDLEVRQGTSDPVRGRALEIHLPAGFDPRAEFALQLDYRTGPDASAIMWLPPELTAGGKQPFMFTQSQSIHARSWVPLQDSPMMRFTYEATIRTPPGLRALMSADNDPQAPKNGVHRFRMPQPIPSYLLALAVGNLEFASFGEDSGVYAEPEVLPAAAREFVDTQAMLDAAEAIWGPYRWGRFDLLILPPSFPYGGMENSRLSFITPGLPADATAPTSRSLDAAAAAARAWASGELPVDKLSTANWSPQATVYFIRALPAGLESGQLAELDGALGLSASRNAEIGRAWFIEVAKRRHLPAYSGLPAELFGQAQDGYHPLTVADIEKHFRREAGK